MATLIVLNVGGSDRWLRDMIAGAPRATDVREQRVIVETFDEANRIMNAMSNSKHAKALPFGGAWATGMDRCAHCDALVEVATLIHAPSIGRICRVCDAELTDEHDFLGVDRLTYLSGGTPWKGGR